jgi:TonB family protein
MPPDFAALHPGAKPEEIFGPKRVYILHVNMPNLNSATGSWVLSFTELRDDPTAPPLTGELTGPVPERKVDPRYPPALVSEKIEGEVVLYAVIRRDGSVDSIQLVQGIDEQLDANAMNALARWKFRPAERLGAPVELEAIVHIPFRAVAPQY